MISISSGSQNHYTVRDALHAYIKKRNLKATSVESLEGTVKKFLRYTKRTDIDVVEVTPELVNAWLESMALRIDTIIKHRKYLLLLLADAVRDREYPETIDHQVRKPSRPEPQPEPEPIKAQQQENPSRVHRFRGDEDLAQFFHDVFVKEWLSSCSGSVLQRHIQAIDWLFVWLERKPTFGDISDERLKLFHDWLIQTNRASEWQGHEVARNYVSRLTQIRRYALAKSTHCNRDMRLIDFFLKIYRKDRPLTDKTLQTYRTHIHALSDFYGSQIMLSELDVQTVEAWLDQKGHVTEKAREAIHAVWQLAYELGYVATSPWGEQLQQPAKAIQTNGDSLRQLLTANYFPAADHF